MEEKMEGGRKHRCRNSFKIGGAISAELRPTFYSRTYDIKRIGRR